ncbi:Transmembrane 9 superfamily member 9 [Hondaea fermentalgiana]|uniref:Transmembrane 9 superfamily member n=1 Tax=Hondaea fermentalgiana TaxID=2315210 RepID=A0A2R5GC15_9STRA|nr:Transmembrane 9 superfamily member 9 [Hondaea fermentalgiana]|eukprot:GBG26123.1 Transmembrane 9 superfamily member 9 [Hondaea fermentalgiana]
MTMRSLVVAAVAAVACLATESHGFYLPGVAPRQFKQDEKVDMEVNKLISIKTQLPFEYYSLPVCKPEHIKNAPENLGEVLAGDTIESSLYDLRMNKKEMCKVLCTLRYTDDDVKMFQDMIADEYRVHWIIDNLPLAVQLYDDNTPFEAYEEGYLLGNKVQDTFYIHNHIKFQIRVHQNPESFEGFRVVGFIVVPQSIAHKRTGDSVSCDANGAQTIMKGGELVSWTYDVEWYESDVPWASRWDIYLNSAPNDKIHWFSISNSLMIVLFLTGMVAMIMMRTLHKDIARYNEEQSAEETQEEFGWKLVHGDVFRPPSTSPLLLSVFCGSGVQILCMTVILMFFALLGFLSPANRGGLMTAMLLFFVSMGYPAGYVSARLYKMFGGKQWRRSLYLTAVLYPGTVFAVFFIVNLFVWQAGSSGAVKFSTMIALLVLWMGISFPLCALGSFAGFKREEIKNPCRYNQIPRQIPEQPFYMKPAVTILVGGILPFGAVFIELFFLLSSIWGKRPYYVFGFLTLVLIILVATCAEITIVLCYFQLCSEDYHWWWRSFLTSGSSSLYLFLYSILYYSSRLELHFVGTVIYFAYMGLIAISFGLLTGCVGFFAAFFFNRQIYASIKLD